MKYFSFKLIPILLTGLLYSACSDVGVQGYVIDVVNSRPVDGAVVKITDRTVTAKVYYTATINGYFDIDIDQSLSKVNELEFYIVKGGCIPLDETASIKDSLIFFMICQ